MNAAQLAEFEARAAAAESRLAVLEAKVASGAGGGPGIGAYASQLNDIRRTLTAAKEEQVKVQQQCADALAAKAAVEEANKKLVYQCEHLKRALAEADAKLASK